jgi:hypothetical protein
VTGHRSYPARLPPRHLRAQGCLDYRLRGPLRRRVLRGQKVRSRTNATSRQCIASDHATGDAAKCVLAVYCMLRGSVGAVCQISSEFRRPAVVRQAHPSRRRSTRRVLASSMKFTSVGLNPSRGAGLWYWHVEAVERDGYEAIEPDQINELRCAVLAECLYG